MKPGELPAGWHNNEFKDLEGLQGNMLSSWSNHTQLVTCLKSFKEFPLPLHAPLTKPLYIWSLPNFIFYSFLLHNSPFLHTYTYIPAALHFLNIPYFSYLWKLSPIVPSDWNSCPKIAFGSSYWLFKTQLKAFIQKAIAQARECSPFIHSKCTIYKQIPVRPLLYRVFQKNRTKTTADQLQSDHYTSWLHGSKMPKENPRRVLKRARQRPIIEIIKIK